MGSPRGRPGETLARGGRHPAFDDPTRIVSRQCMRPQPPYTCVVCLVCRALRLSTDQFRTLHPSPVAFDGSRLGCHERPQPMLELNVRRPGAARDSLVFSRKTFCRLATHLPSSVLSESWTYSVTRVLAEIGRAQGSRSHSAPSCWNGPLRDAAVSPCGDCRWHCGGAGFPRR